VTETQVMLKKESILKAWTIYDYNFNALDLVNEYNNKLTKPAEKILNAT
jgi:hypothetical protein